VHALAQDCPLLGDDKYTDKDLLKRSKQLGARRMLLHASRLQFVHPLTEQKMDVCAPLPDDFHHCFAQIAEVVASNE
jgi:23S rRNA pseudouridine955/2504/2580 synthase